jgi:hypothetical protein
MVRPRGLEPPLVSQLAPQASASTNSAMAAIVYAVNCVNAVQGQARRLTNRRQGGKAKQWLAASGVRECAFTR